MQNSSCRYVANEHVPWILGMSSLCVLKQVRCMLTLLPLHSFFSIFLRDFKIQSASLTPVVCLLILLNVLFMQKMQRRVVVQVRDRSCRRRFAILNGEQRALFKLIDVFSFSCVTRANRCMSCAYESCCVLSCQLSKFSS